MSVPRASQIVECTDTTPFDTQYRNDLQSYPLLVGGSTGATCAAWASCKGDDPISNQLLTSRAEKAIQIVHATPPMQPENPMLCNETRTSAATLATYFCEINTGGVCLGLQSVLLVES